MARIVTRILLLSLALAACSGPQEVVTIVEVPDDVGNVSGATIQAFETGVEALEQMPPDYATARSSFEQVVADTDELWEAWMNLGVLYTDLALYSDAITAYEQVLEVQPDSIDVRIGMGRAYALWGMRDEALGVYREVIQRDEDNLDARINIAAVYVDNREYDQARLFIKEILVADQNNDDALTLLGSIYHADGDDQMASYLWGKVISAQDDDDEESAEGDEVAEEDTVNTEALNNLALMNVGRGELARAVRQFTMVVELDPANVAAHLNLGAIYLDHINFESALYEFEQALALRPRNQMALMGRAASLWGMGDAQGSYDAYEIVTQQYTDNCQAMWRLGELAFRDLDNMSGSLDWYTRNLRCRGINPDTCEGSQDEVCARVNAIHQMQRQTQPREPEPGVLEGEDTGE